MNKNFHDLYFTQSKYTNMSCLQNKEMQLDCMRCCNIDECWYMLASTYVGEFESQYSTLEFEVYFHVCILEPLQAGGHMHI